MKPVPLIPPPPQDIQNIGQWYRQVGQSLNELISYWNQGIDENVLQVGAINSEAISWPLLAPNGKVSAPSSGLHPVLSGVGVVVVAVPPS